MEPRHGQQQPQLLALAEAKKATTPSTTARRPLVFDKMEELVREMQDPENGVPIRSQKLFLTSIPSAFMGYDLIEWLMERLTIEDSVEAIHIANLLCQHGYFFPVGECKNLVVKDDSSLYRFQTPYFWPSQNHNPDNTEYAIYLYKRSLRNKQKHGLEEYEVESLGRLKKSLAHKWDFITMQSEEQVRLAKDRKKGDKIVTDSQERAYWRAYRPPPGFFNCLELPPVPVSSSFLMTNYDTSSPESSSPMRKWRNTDEIKTEVEFLRGLVNRARIKASQAAEALQHHCATYTEFDAFITPPQPSNPWLTDDVTFWLLNSPIVEVPTEKRVRRWALSMEDLVADQTGLQELTNYLRKEYSHENIRFWLATKDLRIGPASKIQQKVKEIYEEFLAPGAPCEINIDGRTMEKVQHEMKNPSRFTFDAAAEHVYALLLKKDCYPRFVRSEHYKNLLANALQPSQKKRFFSFAPGKKKSSIAAPVVASQASQAVLKRAGSDRSLSGSPPEGNQAGCPSAIIPGVPMSPNEECDTPYRGDMPSLRVASAPHLYGQPLEESCVAATDRDDVCPWETMSPRTSRAPSAITASGKVLESNRLLVAGPSISSSVDLDSISPGKTSHSSVDSNPSTDLDVCPWEAVPPPARNRNASTTSAHKKNSLAELIDICPWEVCDDASTSLANPVVGETPGPVQVASVSSSNVESSVVKLVVQSVEKQPEAAVPVEESSRKNSTTAEQEEDWTQSNIEPAKISEICPWEDEESCRLDQPFVKTYATLGYL